MSTASQDHSTLDQSKFYKIGAPADRNPKSDVVFVHGLDGDPHKSWGFERDEHWDTWLRPEFPRLAFWSLSYPVASTYWGGGHAMSLEQRAHNTLVNMRDKGLGKRPIAFIAHSMGGLLVKEILRTATRPDMGYNHVWKNARGVMFLSTPHTGAHLASIAGYLSIPFWLTEAVKELYPNSPYLLDLKAWFSKNSVGAIETSVLYETKSLGLFGDVVVDKASANPDIPKVFPIPVDHDHYSISKPLSTDDVVFRQAQKFLKRCFPGWWPVKG